MIQLLVIKEFESCAWTEPGRKPGDVVWVNTEEAARHLIENGFCKFPDLPGPSEAKPAGPSLRKLSGGAMRTRSTASPSSTERGSGLSSASAGVLVSPRRL